MEKYFSLSENFQFSVDTVFRYFSYFMKILMLQIVSWASVIALACAVGYVPIHMIFSRIALFDAIKVEVAAGNTEKIEQIYNSLKGLSLTWPLILLCGFAIFLLLFFYQLVSLGSNKIQLNFIDGKKNTLSTLFSQRRLVIRGFFALMFYFIGSGLLLLFLVIPGIIFSILFGFYQLVLVDEQVGVIQAFKRSLAISRGAKMQIFALSLVILLLYSGVGFAFFPAFIFFVPVYNMMFAYAYRSLKEQTS